MKNSLNEMLAISYNSDFKLTELFDQNCLQAQFVASNLNHEYHIYLRTRSFA